jgi:flagellar motor switch protein FliM
MNPVPHDFTKPGRLANAWQQLLLRWFDQAFGSANKAWAKQLPFKVEAALLDLDVCYAQKGLATLPEGSLGYRVLVADRRVPSYLALPRLTLLKLIGAMLGDSESASADREMTLIEENLADYFLVHYWLPFFRETWPGVEPVSWELQARESNPQCSRVFAPHDILIVLNWQIRGPWGESHGAWFFQKKALLEALGDTTGSAPELIPAPIIAARRETIVSNLPIVVEVVLGSAKLNLSQLSHLQAGDVLLLDQQSDEAITARAGGKDLFHGKVGRLGSRKAFQIDSIGES